MRFVTDAGVFVPAVTSEQMRDVDRIAISELGPNLYQMMENAGRSLALRVFQHLSGDGSRGRVLVLAGAGGNGGGGICCARHLANHDVAVEVCLAAPDALGEVPSWQLHVFTSTGGSCVQAHEVAWSDYALIVDALIGYGLHGAPGGAVLELIRRANASGRHIIALDVPSGIDATSGATVESIRADETLTLALPKTGLASPTVGALWLADLGIPVRVYRRLGVEYVSPFSDRFVVPLQARS